LSISASEKNAPPQSSGWQLHPDAQGYAMWHYHCKLTSRMNAILHVPELTVIPFIIVTTKCKNPKCLKQEDFRLSSKWDSRCPRCHSENISMTTNICYQILQKDDPENSESEEYSFAQLKTYEEFETFIIVLNQEKMKAGNKPIEPFPVRY
jgi:hypothetical protein